MIFCNACRVNELDSRDGVFPPQRPTSVCAEQSEPVQAALADLPTGAHVLITSFSHAEDLDIFSACPQRQQAGLCFIGLIGLPGLSDKAPELTAASVVAQLLLFDIQHAPAA